VNDVAPGQVKAFRIAALTESATLRVRIAHLQQKAERHGERSRVLARHLVQTWGMDAAVGGLLELGFAPEKTVRCLVSAAYGEADVELAVMTGGGPPT
jgi:hypothetical protein